MTARRRESRNGFIELGDERHFMIVLLGTESMIDAEAANYDAFLASIERVAPRGK